MFYSHTTDSIFAVFAVDAPYLGAQLDQLFRRLNPFQAHINRKGKRPRLRLFRMTLSDCRCNIKCSRCSALLELALEGLALIVKCWWLARPSAHRQTRHWSWRHRPVVNQLKIKEYSVPYYLRRCSSNLLLPTLHCTLDPLLRERCQGVIFLATSIQTRS